MKEQIPEIKLYPQEEAGVYIDIATHQGSRRLIPPVLLGVVTAQRELVKGALVDTNNAEHASTFPEGYELTEFKHEIVVVPPNVGRDIQVYKPLHGTGSINLYYNFPQTGRMRRAVGLTTVHITAQKRDTEETSS